MKEYIHYGSIKFNPDLFNPIKNISNGIIMFSKPRGGLWASSLDSTYGWKEWNEENEFAECEENNSFKFTLKEDAKVLVISSLNDLKGLPHIQNNSPFDTGDVYLDFEELSKVYDAIELTSINNGLCDALYGWDCESILVMNPDCIKTS